jgi:hypothetical protein
LQPRRVSEILVTSIVLVTVALSGVAAAATPDRAPSQRAGASGTSPTPDADPQPVRFSSTHTSAPPIRVAPVSRAPVTTTHSAPASHSSEEVARTPVERVTPSAVDPAKPKQKIPPSHKHTPPVGQAPHRATGPVSLDLDLPRVALPGLLGTGRDPGRNGVLLLLSSLALGMLVVASLALLRRVKRLNGGW